MAGIMRHQKNTRKQHNQHALQIFFLYGGVFYDCIEICFKL